MLPWDVKRERGYEICVFKVIRESLAKADYLLSLPSGLKGLSNTPVS